jgi:DNA-directed RNA polymerase subunit beta
MMLDALRRQPLRKLLAMAVWLILVGLLVGYGVIGERKCPTLTYEDLKTATFLPASGTTYCDLSPEFRAQVDAARAQNADR